AESCVASDKVVVSRIVSANGIRTGAIGDANPGNAVRQGIHAIRADAAPGNQIGSCAGPKEVNAVLGHVDDGESANNVTAAADDEGVCHLIHTIEGNALTLDNSTRIQAGKGGQRAGQSDDAGYGEVDGLSGRIHLNDGEGLAKGDDK